MLDTYNQAIHTDCSCTIRTNINTANHHFIMETDKTLCLNSKVNGKQPSLSNRVYDSNGISTAITCSFLPNVAEVIQVGNIVNDADINFKNPQRGRIYSQEGLSPCLCDGSGGGGREPKIVEYNPKIIREGNYQKSNHNASVIVNPCGIAPTVMENHWTVTAIKIKEATKQGYAEAEEGDSVNLSNPNSSARRGRVGKQIANTLDTGCQQGVVAQYRIRKLTPRECFRLMGVRDNEIDKIQASGISNSQQYKLAGNSIVVDNLYHIFRKMFVETNAEQNQQLTLF